jgi:hypothetical protein
MCIYMASQGCKRVDVWKNYFCWMYKCGSAAGSLDRLDYSAGCRAETEEELGPVVLFFSHTSFQTRYVMALI